MLILDNECVAIFDSNVQLNYCSTELSLRVGMQLISMCAFIYLLYLPKSKDAISLKFLWQCQFQVSVFTFENGLGIKANF